MNSRRHRPIWLAPPVGQRVSVEEIARALPKRYRGVTHLVAGGMSEVFRAVDATTGNLVALKCARAPLDSARFRREAEALRAVDHPNVLPLLDAGETGGRTFLVTPYLPFPTMRAEAQRAAPTTQLILAWMGGVLRGLAALHAEGIVHRDVSPQNVVVDPETNKIVVIDLGLSKRVLDDGPGTYTGMVVGNPDYMAPEQACGVADVRSDVYAAAAVTVELLTGHRPAPGRVPERLGPFEPVLMRALATEPGRRTATAAEFLFELQRASRSET